MIALTLEYHAEFDNTLSNIEKGLSKLHNDFKKIESELSVSENANIKLYERVRIRRVALERKCWANV